MLTGLGQGETGSGLAIFLLHDAKFVFPARVTIRLPDPRQRCAYFIRSRSTMQVAIRKMGNPRGLLILEPILAQLGLEGTADLQPRRRRQNLFRQAQPS